MTELPPSLSDQPLRQGVLCAGCAYDLGGLQHDGLCPECGKPIEETLRGDWLSFADLKWLKSIAAGFRTIMLCFWAVLIAVTLLTLTVMLGIGVSFLPPNMQDPAERIFSILFTVIGIAWGCVMAITPFIALWGWFAATRLEPGRFDAVAQTKRHRVRWSAVIWLVFMLLSLTGVSITNMLGLVPGGWGWLGPWVLYALISTLHYWTSMEYIRSLAVRIPDAKLSNSAMDYRVSLLLINVLGMFLCCVGPVVAFIMYISVLDTVSRRLKGIIQHRAIFETPAIPQPPTITP